MSKNQKEHSFWEALNKMCFIYDQFETIFIALGELKRSNKIKNLTLAVDGKIQFQTVINNIPFLNINFSLITDYNFNWHLSYRL